MDAHAIATARTPILFIDTCSLLDIMRDPTRDALKINEIEAAVQLADIADVGGVHLAIAEQVSIEFAMHDQRVQDDAHQKLGKLRNTLDTLNKLSGILGSPGAIDHSHLDDHVSLARNLVDRWLIKSDIISTPSEAPTKAFTRMNANRAPATRGKESSKDCLILETYLSAATELRAAGVTSPIVFVSSNTREFLTGGSVLKPEIVDDFAPSQIDYAPNVAAAKHRLGI